jgi:hypothetical protein
MSEAVIIIVSMVAVTTLTRKATVIISIGSDAAMLDRRQQG